MVLLQKLYRIVNNNISKNMKERIEWIDLAKGFSIILVVYGHSGLSAVPFLGDWFAAFRMPFFFIVSGLLFSISKYPTFISFLKRRWLTLVRPYFIFSLTLMLGIWILHPDSIAFIIKDIVIKGWGGYALWFIPILFFTEIVYFFICKYIDIKSLRFLFLLCSAIIGYITYKLDFYNNYNICFVFTSVLFYGIGNLLSDWMKNLFRNLNMSILIQYTFALFLCSLFFLLNHQKPEFFINKLSGIYTYIAAFSGAFFMCSVSSIVSRLHYQPIRIMKEGIKYMGRNSYIILAFHQIILQLLGLTCLFSGSIQRLIMWFSLIMLIEGINRYFPFVLGKKKMLPQLLE